MRLGARSHTFGESHLDVSVFFDLIDSLWHAENKF